MVIKKLRLENFRNYIDEEIVFSDGVNIVSGGNAQGKTNSAEAIFYLCTGYSPRASKDKQVIRSGENRARIRCDAGTRYGSVSAEIKFYTDRNKEIYVNGVAVLKVGELLGNINSVFFNPSELKLIQESPEDRRRFLDISLSQISRNYFYSLQRYKKIISQRNNLLKCGDRELIMDTLPVWDIQLASAGARIIFERNDYISMLSPYAEEAHGAVTGGAEKLSVVGDYKYGGNEQQITDQLIEALRERYDKDIELGYTTVGPHRDDLKIKIGDKDVRIYGSQGQQRTAAIALKLAETKIFKQKFNEYPVLILDDAMSELDSSRKRRLTEIIKDMQTIITCTDAEDVPGYSSFNNIKIENGKVVS